MTAKTYKHIIMVGPPGSGKGTQASILAEKLQITTISAGELLRAEARTGSELGKQIADGSAGNYCACNVTGNFQT